jgi:hypothetical protein
VKEFWEFWEFWEFREFWYLEQGFGIRSSRFGRLYLVRIFNRKMFSFTIILFAKLSHYFDQKS